MTAKLIFISHGYSYNPAESYENAKKYAQFVARYNHIPISPVLLWHGIYCNGSQYELIIENCKRLIDVCSEVWVFDSNGNSNGVREEMEYACLQKKPIVIIDNRKDTRGG